MEDVPLLDQEHLSMLLELEAREHSGKLVRMFHHYLDSVPPQLARMRAALAAGDPGTLSRDAHGLAGSSAMYAMARVRQCCVRLEAHLKSQPIAEAGALLAAVERAFEQTRPELLEALARLSPPAP